MSIYMQVCARVCVCECACVRVCVLLMCVRLCVWYVSVRVCVTKFGYLLIVPRVHSILETVSTALCGTTRWNQRDSTYTSTSGANTTTGCQVSTKAGDLIFIYPICSLVKTPQTGKQTSMMSIYGVYEHQVKQDMYRFLCVSLSNGTSRGITVTK